MAKRKGHQTYSGHTLKYVNIAAKRVKKHLFDALNPDGLVLEVNYGITQEIKHYHLHLIPAYKDKQEIRDITEVYEDIMKAIK